MSVSVRLFSHHTNLFLDNVDPTITNAGTDQTKRIRKDATYSWTLTAADVDDEDIVTLSIKSVTKKTPVEGSDPTLTPLDVADVIDKWLYITGPAASTDDFTIEFKDYKDNGEEIELDHVIDYDVELEATDQLNGAVTYTIALTVTSENRAPTLIDTDDLNLGTFTVMSGGSFSITNATS